MGGLCHRRKWPCRRCIDEYSAAVDEVYRHRTTGVDAAPRSVQIEYANGDATNPRCETTENERQPTGGVLAQGIYGIRLTRANNELNRLVHLIAAIATFRDVLDAAKSHFASPSHSGHRYCK